MALPFRETSNEVTGGNVFTKPSGLANGDIIEIQYWSFHTAGGANPSPPSGFTEVAGGGIEAAARTQARIYRKVITDAGSEGASYTVGRGGGSTFGDGGEIFRISGVNTSSPEHVVPSFGSGTGTTATSGSITTTIADTLLSALIVTDGTAIGVPSGMSLLFTHDGGDAEGYTENLASTVSGVTRSSTIGSAPWMFATVVWAPYVAPTAEQEGYRFRNDDGSESAATWKAAQDTDVDIPAGGSARLRMLLNFTGDRASQSPQLEYRKTGTTEWRKVE